MLEFDIPIVIPSYLCESRHFEDFLHDLSGIGIKKAIVLYDFDFKTQNIYSYNRSVKILSRNLVPAFKRCSIEFVILPNLLLDNLIYSVSELTCLVNESFPYSFLTLPLFCDQSVAMENIFALKNAGVKPIINNFDNLCVVLKRSFCEALLTTEDISFVFDADSLSKDIVIEFVNKSLTFKNVSLFSANNFTVSIIGKKLSDAWNLLDTQKRMNLGYLSKNIINQAFK